MSNGYGKLLSAATIRALNFECMSVKNFQKAFFIYFAGYE